MINVNNTDRSRLAPLFEGIGDSMVIAYLQGYMGDCYVNKLPDPDFGIIVSGEYSFYGGKAEMAKPLLEKLFDYIPDKKSVAIYSDLKPVKIIRRFIFHADCGPTKISVNSLEETKT